MKYRILKTLDVAGLKVLDPVVRLCYGEEPRKQLRDIGLYIVVPVFTFCLFMLAWNFIAPRHKTKSGEVPTPAVVADAYGGIVTFHDREYTKLADFTRTGDERRRELERVEVRMQELAERERNVDALFETRQKQRDLLLATKLQPYERAIAQQQQEYAVGQQQREQLLLAMATEIPADDGERKAAYRSEVRQHLDQTAREQDHLKQLRAELNELRGEKWTPLEEVRREKNTIAQEQQFLQKRRAYLTAGNRENKVVAGLRKVRTLEREFAQTSGEALYGLATRLVRDEDRVKSIAASEYAKPPTFFDQVTTSVKCVFLGFLIATVIAIPIGVLCGLSPVFMAAVTPLVSLFKPVSPIVWLPIVFIIVGGFIRVPEESWIPPAFLSSAITVALCSLWPTLVNTALGVSSIDEDHLNVARVLRLGFWSRLVKIVIPSALPLIFAGLRISLGVGWMVLIAGELLSSSPGLGKFVWDMFNNGSSETFAQMFVVVFFVGAIGLLLDRIMIVFQRAVSFDGAPTAI